MAVEISVSEHLRLRAAFDCAPSGLVMIDESGSIVLANREMERMFGYERGELVGTNVDALVPLRYRAAHDRRRAAFQTQPQTRMMGTGRDLHAVRRDGTEFPVEIGLNPIAIEGKAFVLGVVVDITARRAEERARAELEARLSAAQRLESLGRLAGGIAHDFNNLLATILSVTELLEDVVEDRAPKELEWLTEAANRGRDLVQRILLFSRGQLDDPVPVRLGTVVPVALGVAKAALPSRLTVRLRMDPSPPVVLSSVDAIHQIVSNLVSNAANAIPAGGLIEVCADHYPVSAALARLHPGLEEGVYGRIEVSDTGEGMDAATCAQAFEPFFTTRRAHGGTGLGLAVVHGLTRDRGGAVWIESQPQGGTVMTALLPLADRPHAADPSKPRSAGPRS